MGETQKINDQINKALPDIKRGTLRFWGDWFGRPHDNLHRLVSCECAQDVLTLHFDESEILCVWDPKALTIDRETFQIADADRVRWEWFDYGRPKTAANLYFLEYVKSLDAILATTNVDWYEPHFKTIRTAAAVEIL
jgi:hypothetical protein